MAKKVNDVYFEEAFQFIRKVGDLQPINTAPSPSGWKRSSMGCNSDRDYLGKKSLWMAGCRK